MAQYPVASRSLFAPSHPELMSDSSDPFFEPYDRDQVAYGSTPSAALHAYLDQVGGSGKALDLGAGAGRDTIALANAGFDVTAVDLSARGMERVQQRATKAGVADRVKTQVADVREFDFGDEKYDAIVATTVLDHIPAEDAIKVWKRITSALADKGLLFIEVHSTEDPGSNCWPGNESDAPVSETASAVVNYFAPNQLVCWAADSSANLRILSYQERLEWDYTHGPEHQHGKAILLAVRCGHHPNWYGQPSAFPRQTLD